MCVPPAMASAFVAAAGCNLLLQLQAAAAAASYFCETAQSISERVMQSRTLAHAVLLAGLACVSLLLLRLLLLLQSL